MARRNSGKEGRQQPGCLIPEQESWAAPSLAIRTAQVTSSSPLAVDYPLFSSLTFAMVFSEHRDGERSALKLKMHKLKSHQSFQLLPGPGSYNHHHSMHIHTKMSNTNPCRQNKGTTILPNLLPYQETILKARK